MTHYGAQFAVDPREAEPLFQPAEPEEGYWVGAPSIDVHGSRTYLAVRERTPERRGHALVVYERTGRTAYDPVLRITAEQLGVESVERPALLTDPADDELKLYLSVDRGRGDWAIRKLADVRDVEAFDPSTAETVLEPGTSTDSAAVKDPYIVTIGGRYYMFYAGTTDRMEQPHLATSTDGESWTRAPGNPLLPSEHWHDYHTRVGCVLPARDAPVWLAFYEGSGRDDYAPMWNLRTGLATSPDLRSFVDASPATPRLSASGDGAAGISKLDTFRYMEVLEQDGRWEVFFEGARDDGAFELRYTEVIPDGE